jgi:hypothetical protein
MGEIVALKQAGRGLILGVTQLGLVILSEAKNLWARP